MGIIVTIFRNVKYGHNTENMLFCPKPPLTETEYHICFHYQVSDLPYTAECKIYNIVKKVLLLSPPSPTSSIQMSSV